ncbi:MAG: TIGR01777 family oxidoreductase [Bacteroidetes bacterium]|nr:TIGR01777 family oxidoreductase [Bacteroidota bacterium]
MMNILIFGGTGLIGSTIVPSLSKNHTVTVVTRKQYFTKLSSTYVLWDPQNLNTLLPFIEKSDILINLAGTPIVGYWTKRRKEKIIQSRITVTREVCTLLRKATQKPRLFINASAVGYYGSRGDDILTEHASKGKGFLAEVCSQWENEAQKASDFGLRVVLLRLGIVLSRYGGLFARIIMPMKLFGGITIGTTNQWIPWIHIDDVVGAIEYIIAVTSLSGAVNLVAPHPVLAKEFYTTIAKQLNRPLWFQISPNILARLTGEMGKELILGSQRAVPEKLCKVGYPFKFEYFLTAISDLLA